MAFAQSGSGFARFMASGAGRLLRIVAGIALLAWGWSLRGGGGVALAIVGLVPLAAGVFDFCVLVPLLRAPFWGREIRGGDRIGR
jgi:hypothetical protein